MELVALAVAGAVVVVGAIVLNHVLSRGARTTDMTMKEDDRANSMSE